MGYPAEPSEFQKATYRSFFETLSQVVPCPTCAQNLQRLLAGPFAESLDAALDAGRLFPWTVDLHNAVNEELGKPPQTLDAAVQELLRPPGVQRVPVAPPLAVMAPAMLIGFLGAFLIAWLVVRLCRRQKVK
jgi:hypothetical protein